MLKKIQINSDQDQLIEFSECILASKKTIYLVDKVYPKIVKYRIANIHYGKETILVTLMPVKVLLECSNSSLHGMIEKSLENLIMNVYDTLEEAKQSLIASKQKELNKIKALED